MPKIIWPYLLTTTIGAAAGVYVEYLVSARRLANIQKDAATTQIRAVETARAEEQRRTAQQEIAEDAANQRDRARADAAAAVSAADGLRKQVAVLVGRARHSAVATGSAPAGAPIGVLADVLGSIDDRARELAEYADRVRIAAQQCERDYGTLTRDAQIDQPR
ncbi:DUF2514 family protein [Burkholderia singularis]|uniref:DUF2514 family protein n=1 Tax=Burkholderia singularis TaxID=1503053 RepID=UPI0009EC5011|nr:DUF2514 family protein [Burkholderia singularis]